MVSKCASLLLPALKRDVCVKPPGGAGPDGKVPGGEVHQKAAERAGVRARASARGAGPSQRFAPSRHTGDSQETDSPGEIRVGKKTD